jgi:hypothetical protein
MDDPLFRMSGSGILQPSQAATAPPLAVAPKGGRNSADLARSLMTGDTKEVSLAAGGRSSSARGTQSKKVESLLSSAEVRASLAALTLTASRQVMRALVKEFMKTANCGKKSAPSELGTLVEAIGPTEQAVVDCDAVALRAKIMDTIDSLNASVAKVKDWTENTFKQNCEIVLDEVEKGEKMMVESRR